MFYDILYILLLLICFKVVAHRYPRLGERKPFFCYIFTSNDGLCLEEFPLPLGAWDRLRHFIVAHSLGRLPYTYFAKSSQLSIFVHIYTFVGTISIYTTQNLINTTIMFSIWFTALSIPLCHSITFDVCLRFHRNLYAIGYNVHVYQTPDGPMYVRGSENAKSYIFEIPPKNSCIFLHYFYAMILRITFRTFQCLVETSLQLI